MLFKGEQISDRDRWKQTLAAALVIIPAVSRPGCDCFTLFSWHSRHVRGGLAESGLSAAHSRTSHKQKKKEKKERKEKCLMEKEVGVGVGGTLERE